MLQFRGFLERLFRRLMAAKKTASKRAPNSVAKRYQPKYKRIVLKLSGESLQMNSLVPLTMDTSAEDGGRGVMMAYSYGPAARQLSLMTPEARRRLVLEALVSRFGGKAGSPLHYVEQNWDGEEWSRGCHLVHYAGGVLTQYGKVIREPFGRIHFAGSETATISHGAIDGACRSGERAAREALAH